VPAEERLRAGEQGLPGVASEESAESGQQEAIDRLPAWTLNLALEDAELVAEGEDLRLEPEVGLTTGEEGVEEEADQGVEESEQHGRGSWRSGRPNGQVHGHGVRSRALPWC
jgi:hypothetical protein